MGSFEETLVDIALAVVTAIVFGLMIMMLADIAASI
jgi:hypothetical protein